MGCIYMYYKRCWACLRYVVGALLFVSLMYMPSSHANNFQYRGAGQPTVKFFAGGRDIPVMPGLIELEGRSFSYDKPEGEIIEIVAQMSGVTSEQVLFYYDAILPQFGWGKVNKVFDGANYYREEEYLDISFETEGAQSFVKIMVSPSR